MIILGNVLISDPTAASFAAVQFFAPNLSLPEPPHPDLAKITAAIKNKTGIEPDDLALPAYDAMWVIARAVAAFPYQQMTSQKSKRFFILKPIVFMALPVP